MKNTRDFCFQFLALCLILGAAACGKSPPTATNESPPPDAKPAPAAATEQPPPRVALDTNYGQIVIQLDPAKAERTVNNYLQYVNEGFYDQTLVHQVIAGQGIVAGGYSVDYKEKKTRPAIFNEAANGVKNLRATVAMFRRPDDAHSATSQFFINIENNPELDYRNREPDGFGYCVFGKVVQGMEVVDKIAQCHVYDKDELKQTPVEKEKVIIKTVRVQKKG
jgi:cyclophilin family peptidyl-prolyl cis-trans isomerase